jgi:hypothetical protein
MLHRSELAQREGVAVERDYLDFDLALVRERHGLVSRVVASPAGGAEAPFTLPFQPVELAQFMTAVGPPRVTSRRLVPAATRVLDVKDYGQRLGEALIAGDVDRVFRESLAIAKQQRASLRVRLRLDGVPDLDPVPWEYLYDARLGRFLTLSTQTPVVRVLDSLDDPPPVRLRAPLRVLVMVSSPTDLPALQVHREEELLRATTGDLVKSGQLEIVLTDATLSGLQRSLIQHFHVFHFIGHGGFDKSSDEGVLVLEHDDHTAHRVSGYQVGTLLHDAQDMQLVVLNACEGARTSGRDAFSGVAQTLVRQGLPAVVAMQTEISDRAALVFSHEFYYFLTRGLPIDATMCEVRKAMAISDQAAEWGTAVLLRSGASQPFDVASVGQVAEPAREGRWESLYEAAQRSLGAGTPEVAVPLLEQLAAERPDYADVTTLLERVRHPADDTTPDSTGPPEPPTQPQPVVRQHPRPQPSRRPRTVRTRRVRRWTVVKSVFWVMLLVGGLIAWSILPSLVQKIGFVVEAACGSASQSTPPQTSFVVGCAPIAPTVDGEFDDWRSLPSHPVIAVVDKRGGERAGLSGDWQLVWDKDALYIHAVVKDAEITSVSPSAPKNFWTGDGVSFEFGPDPRRLDPADGLRPRRDFHVMFGLVEDGDRGALAAINQVSKGSFSVGDRVPDIEVALRATGDGYELEARVLWRKLGLTIPPARGSVWGMNLNVSDAQKRGSLKTMLSSNPKRTSSAQNHPARWQTVLLDDEG